jgi:hypothetical protein
VHPLYLEISAADPGASQWIRGSLHSILVMASAFEAMMLDEQCWAGSADIRNCVLRISGEGNTNQLVAHVDELKRHKPDGASLQCFESVPDITVRIPMTDIQVQHFYPENRAPSRMIPAIESGVLVTHVPTGLVVRCIEGRSKARNLEQAVAFLAAKLAAPRGAAQ